MKDIQTQSEAFMYLKFQTNFVEVIFAFYKGGSYPDQQPFFLVLIQAQAGKNFPQEKEKMKKFHV